jgi:hypothetical protein
MTTPPSDVRAPADTTQTMRRRGLFAAGAAFVAGPVARWTEQPVLAGIDGDVVLGGVNTTRITRAVQAAVTGSAVLQRRGRRAAKLRARRKGGYTARSSSRRDRSHSADAPDLATPRGVR